MRLRHAGSDPASWKVLDSAKIPLRALPAPDYERFRYLIAGSQRRDNATFIAESCFDGKVIFSHGRRHGPLNHREDPIAVAPDVMRVVVDSIGVNCLNTAFFFPGEEAPATHGHDRIPPVRI